MEEEMGLKSERDLANKEYLRDIRNINTQVQNPFTNYNLTFKPLGVEELNRYTDERFEQEINNLRNLVAQRRKEDLRAVAQRLVNQNVAGGLRDAMQQRVSSQYGVQEQNALNQLLTAKTQQSFQNLLTAQDQSKLYDTLMMSLLGQRANIDLSNVNTNLQRLGLMGQAVQMLDDTTWLDDVLAVARTAGNIIGVIKGGAIGSAGLASLFGGNQNQQTGKESEDLKKPK